MSPAKKGCAHNLPPIQSHKTLLFLDQSEFLNGPFALYLGPSTMQSMGLVRAPGKLRARVFAQRSKFCLAWMERKQFFAIYAIFLIIFTQKVWLVSFVFLIVRC